MRHDGDFAAYMAARWPSLVRSLVLLGCPRAEAEDVAQTGLTRCYRSWARVRRADDIDAYVYRVILNCWAKSRRRRWWSEVPTAVLPERAWSPDPTEAIVLRQAVRAALDRLSEDHRTVLVLRFFADLTEVQAAQVLGVPVGTVKSRVSRALASIDLEELREAAG